MPESTKVAFELTDAPRAEALARQALASTPAGLFADFDGTLAPIVRDPSAVRLADGAAEALSALAQRLAVVCIVTGRAASDARRMAGIDSVSVAGNHGIEWLAPGDSEPQVPPHLAAVPAALDRLLAGVPDLPGLWIENKRLSATVHYRNTPDPAGARERILAALVPALDGSQIELREGRLSAELRPMGVGDKGTAVRGLAERYGLRGMLVLGDDLTDLDMFRAAAELRADGALDAAIIGVGGGDEVPPAVAAAADVVVRDPEAVVALLAALVR